MTGSTSGVGGYASSESVVHSQISEQAPHSQMPELVQPSRPVRVRNSPDCF